ncbi:hypothetical protein AYX15_05400 [Cryptococcus neoformans]|nr:hypothetical protein AYX15_05400 [Cryptococcus neoformans var. grubii]
MPGALTKSYGNPSPTRTSPQKTSSSRFYPTPASMSPNTTSSSSTLNYPPSFDPHHTSSRYPLTTHFAPYSPYRPGEYGRSERGLASERTRIERKLFADGQEEDGEVRKGRGSSPLAPAFEAKMVLRNGASIDLISWLRTNFHHVPPPHTPLVPSMPLNGIRHLILERFPRAPEAQEIHKAVLAAFPHSQWDYPPPESSEPPTIRGLIWHGKDIVNDDELDDRPRSAPKDVATHTRGRLSGGITTSANSNSTLKGKQLSRSPTQSTLVSPISSSKRHLPDTPARSVLEEFAEIATLAEKTPVSRTKSLPGEPLAASPEQEVAHLAHNPFEQSMLLRGRGKRRASQSPERGHRRRASTPDKLHGLLAAAEAVEGSPITSVLGHKRRRTIGGPAPAREIMSFPRRAMSSRGTMSPPTRGLAILPHVEENIDYLVPRSEERRVEEDAASNALPSIAGASTARRAPTSSSTASQSSAVSHHLASAPIAGSSGSMHSYPHDHVRDHGHSLSHSGSHPHAHHHSSSQTQPFSPNFQRVHAPRTGGGGRKVNELPTEGERPGYDCKPPYPYHEMIRHAIENAPDRKLQLNQIYASIAERFPFFKTLDEKKTAGWQNSIRHNLSLKKMFVRVNKVDGVPDDSGGKGGWWTVIPGVPDEGRPGRKAKARKAKLEKEAASRMGKENDVRGLGMGGRMGMGGVLPSPDGHALLPPSVAPISSGTGSELGQNYGRSNGNGHSHGHGYGQGLVSGQAQGQGALHEKWVERNRGQEGSVDELEDDELYGQP